LTDEREFYKEQSQYGANRSKINPNYRNREIIDRKITDLK